MKKVILFSAAILITILLNGQIQMNCNGNVGIGASPSSYKLNTTSAYFTGNIDIYLGYVGLLMRQYNQETILYPSTNNGSSIGRVDKAFNVMYAYDYADPSDSRQKENVKDISNALDLVLKLKGVTYDLKKEFAYNESLIKNDETLISLEAERKNKVGFIAQDVSKVLPSVVLYDDSADIYAISYSKIVPVLVEAIKEQQVIIESLQSEILSAKLKSTSNPTEPSTTAIDQEPALYQNSPNPFSENTKIEYYLTDNIQNAMINIYDMSGAQLKSIPLQLLGYGNITIMGSEFKAGMYMYTLIADNQIIDTKNMILTD